MRLPRLRLTVRRMMIVIAALALVLGSSIEAIRLRRWRDEFLMRAQAHAQYERINLESEGLARNMTKFYRDSAESDEASSKRWSSPGVLSRLLGFKGEPGLAEIHSNLAEIHSKQAEREKDLAIQGRDQATKYAEAAAYHAALKRKYLRAASRPWLPVEPDPPPPDPTEQGRYWAERGQYRRALASYEEAVRLNPYDSEAINGLAWLLATCPDATLRDGDRAVELARRACKFSSRRIAAYVDTLAAAHAEAGDFKAAAEEQRETVGLLPPGDPRSEPYRNRLGMYETHKPYREWPAKPG
jgi:tetratricopeptide (TPR) repeat protein